MTTARDKFFYTRTLCCLLKALEGVQTEIELTNESHVKGTVESVTSAMNVTMRDCELIVCGGAKQLQRLLVQGRKIRMVVIPDDIDMVAAMQRVIGMYNVTAMGRNEFKKTPRWKQQRGGMGSKGGEIARGRGLNPKGWGRGMLGEKGRGRGRGRPGIGRGRGDVQKSKNFPPEPHGFGDGPVDVQNEGDSSVKAFGTLQSSGTSGGEGRMLCPEYMKQASGVSGDGTDQLKSKTYHSLAKSRHETASRKTSLTHCTTASTSASQAPENSSVPLEIKTEKHSTVKKKKNTKSLKSVARRPPSSRQESSGTISVGEISSASGTEAERKPQTHDSQCGVSEVQCSAVSSSARKSGLVSTDLRHKLRQVSQSEEADVQHRDKYKERRSESEDPRSYHRSAAREGEHFVEPSADSGDRPEVKQHHNTKKKKSIKHSHRSDDCLEDGDLHGTFHHSSRSESSGSGLVNYEHSYSDSDTDQRQPGWWCPKRNLHRRDDTFRSHSGSRVTHPLRSKGQGFRTQRPVGDFWSARSRRADYSFHRHRSHARDADRFPSAAMSSRERTESTEIPEVSSRERPNLRSYSLHSRERPHCRNTDISLSRRRDRLHSGEKHKYV